MKQIVKPIKDSWVLSEVQKSLLEKETTGRRNYTIFQVGKSTLLRVSDVLSLKKSDVFDENGRVKRNAYIIDKKTKKHNVLYLKPVERDLNDYFDWLKEQQLYNRKKKYIEVQILMVTYLLVHGFFLLLDMPNVISTVRHIGK